MTELSGNAMSYLRMTPEEKEISNSRLYGTGGVVGEALPVGIEPVGVYIRPEIGYHLDSLFATYSM